MNNPLERIKTTIEPLRQEIIHHKVYSMITGMEELRIFMQYHVFAVWDFMSLLKTLQNNLTCTTIPWFPKGSADTRYLINEIVTGEESDVDSNGQRKSHFELYLEAMNQCGADCSQIDSFIKELKNGKTIQQALSLAGAAPEIEKFVGYTFDIIGSNKPYLQSAVFTYGREDLIPNMFLSIIKDLNLKNPGNISIFNYYLERHIEVDGGHHSHLALQMTSNLCGTHEQYWLEAEQAIVESLRRRVGLWDGICKQIATVKKSIPAL